MSYTTLENSQQEAKPEFRYEFVGMGSTVRYTSAPFDYSDGVNTWSAVAIGHTEISQTGDISRDGVKISLPRDNAFAMGFVDGRVDGVTSLTIYRVLATDSVVYWKGRVTSGKLTRSVIEIECESVLASVRRAGLQPRYMKMCIHPLYGRGCNLNIADWSVGPASVSAIADNVLTIPTASGQPDGWYFGGTLQFGDIHRLIVQHVGNKITLLRGIVGLTTSSVVYIAPGCDHSPEKCNDTFSNIANFGGYPWLPEKNPMGGSSIV